MPTFKQVFILSVYKGYVCLSLVASISLTNPVFGQELAFSPAIDIGNGTMEGVSAVDAADFNGDGQLDVAVFDGGQESKGRTKAVCFEQINSSSWKRHEFGHEEIIGTNYSTDFVGAAKCGDIDADGDEDAVAGGVAGLLCRIPAHHLYAPDPDIYRDRGCMLLLQCEAPVCSTLYAVALLYILFPKLGCCSLDDTPLRNEHYL